MAKTSFNTQISIGASAEKVAEILCSETFLAEADLKREEVVKADYKLLEESDDEIVFELVEVHYKHTKTGALDKSGTNEHTAKYRYNRKSQILSFTFGNEGKILVDGKYALTKRGDGTNVAYELNLDVRIPIIGKMIAGLMKKEMGKSVDGVLADLKEQAV